MNPPRVHLHALGCRLNEAELERWARELGERGFALARAPEDADLIVVNTCAVTAEAVRKSRRLLRRARRRAPRARLVVSGCYATLEPGAAALDGVDLVVGNADKERLVPLATALLAPAQSVAAPSVSAPVARGRSRAFVKVQDGCRHRCTFCIVTVARGEERSRPLAGIVEEVRALTAAGIQEIVLTGVHLGGYGTDLGSDVAALVRAVLDDTDVARLRLGSLEPGDLPEALFAQIERPRFMPHLHLPLQSGCDATLRRMARRCRTARFTRLVERARAARPGINVTTDVIVGFPGETEAEWQASLAFIERIGFGQLHVFPYSSRPGTAAARFPDQVDERTRRRRCEEMLALARRLKRACLERAVGRTVDVLWEGPSRGGGAGTRLRGYTPEYLRCTVAAPAELANTVRPARLAAIAPDGDSLIAEL